MEDPLKLLYPYYLDIDMSMAFAAALTGGVAFEEQQHERTDETSKAIKNLRGNLKLLSALGLAGGVEAGRTDTDEAMTTSEFQSTRHHTFASIFIDLYDEMRCGNLLTENPDMEEMNLGDIVSVQMGPATAPLRRVVDQVIRLLEVTMPMVGADDGSDGDSKGSNKRQQRQRASSSSNTDKSGLPALQQLHRVLVALRDDLARSGMVDVLVGAQGDTTPQAILTLDRRFLSDTALELLHTSSFTVVGKVTQLWRTDDEVVNLYRRSVVSLAPSLTQATMWALFTLVGLITKAIDPAEVERGAQQALQVGGGATGTETAAEVEAPPSESGNEATEEREPDATEESEDEVKFANEMIAAVTPFVTGPAFQILPLAICA